ncbi:nitroreductase family protein [Pontiellaceae bacterium B1224]|nr:nitroreductase family protein [Pontiellaceae bacterium B1224]
MKKILISIIRKVIPTRVYRMIKGLPYLVPDGYRTRIQRYEDIAHRKHKFCNDAKMARLRLYCHILDKGLHRDDWEPGHSVNSYREAKTLVEQLDLAVELKDNSCLVWAKEIVHEYETRQQLDPKKINPLYAKQHVRSGSPEVLLELLQTRTSTRSLKNEAISKDVIKQIALAAAEAPSSCNRQTIRIFSTIDNAESLEVLKCFRGFTGFSEHIPCALVFCVDLRPYTFPGEIFVPTVDASLATENAVLMASVLGVSATLLSWGSSTVEENNRLRNLLNIPEYYEIVVGAACGYPAREAIRPKRKSVDDILFIK